MNSKHILYIISSLYNMAFNVYPNQRASPVLSRSVEASGMVGRPTAWHPLPTARRGSARECAGVRRRGEAGEAEAAGWGEDRIWGWLSSFWNRMVSTRQVTSATTDSKGELTEPPVFFRLSFCDLVRTTWRDMKGIYSARYIDIYFNFNMFQCLFYISILYVD